MSLIRRLHLDDIVTSFPELGPTVPDGGYSWIVLFGVFLVQMTVPSIFAMYGVVVACVFELNTIEFDLVMKKIILTPVLFIAFWNLSDPWAKMIVSMASIPIMVGIIGVILLVLGAIASVYLTTGGIFLANASACAVMGIGASFVILLSDHILRKYFRKKLLLALTVRNTAISFGLVLIPSITNLLLQKAKLQSGLQLIAIIFLPTTLGVLTFKLPTQQQTSPYSLLLSTEEDTELPIRISSEISKSEQHLSSQDEIENSEYSQGEERIQHSGGLLNEGSNIYAYEEQDEDVDLFVNPVPQSDSKWKYQLHALKNFKFWAAVIGWTGMKVSALYFWVILPIFSSLIAQDSYVWMSLVITAGFATFLPNLMSYKILKVSSQTRRLYFGVASWVCSISLIGLIYVNSYSWMLICALAGGISIGSLLSCQDLALYDILGIETMRSVHKGLSTVVGLCILIFCAIHNISICLSVAALLQFLGGLHWISSPVLNLIKQTRYRSLHKGNRTSRDET
ncbi:uncharacterized protein LOC100875139 [Megachile rotundata]|uniref:uncharacterized protein LOC100875139 n=1 Tax=Megachile rotundata TaxID=143995 RepID=UPI000614A770|nr:PREDICTED: monocarboxylate transporter 5-like [Megachile rotundata]